MGDRVGVIVVLVARAAVVNAMAATAAAIITISGNRGLREVSKVRRVAPQPLRVHRAAVRLNPELFVPRFP